MPRRFIGGRELTSLCSRRAQPLHGKIVPRNVCSDTRTSRFVDLDGIESAATACCGHG